jgi:DNA polymerase-3 subunit delta'
MDGTWFNAELGHLKIQERILNSLKNDRLPHALLFYGKEGTGKEALAIEFAKLLNCEKGPLFLCQNCSHCIKINKLEHPDLFYIFPTPSTGKVKPEEISELLKKKSQNPYQRIAFPSKNTFISIDTIRELKYQSKFKLYEGKKKVFIISEADEMRPEAANAMLKILEEPPENLILILTTARLYRILPTIRSRSQLYHFSPLEGDHILRIIKKYAGPTPEHLSNIIRLALGNVKLAFDFIQSDVLETREKAIEYLRKIVKIEKSNELLDEIYSITASRDRSQMKLVLYFLLTWFHDAVHHKQNSQHGDALINIDLKSNINSFVEAYPDINLSEAIGQIQKAIQNLEDSRNFNPTLIFTDLSIKLNRLIKTR